jgi:hypothetical protein
MKKARLLACPACARHVRVSETGCPFCGSALPDEFGGAAAPRKPTARLSRAALYAFGATSLTLASVACGSSGNGTSDGGDEQISAMDGPQGQDSASSGSSSESGSGSASESGSGGVSESGSGGSAESGSGSATEGGDFDVVAAYGGPGDASFDAVSPTDAGEPSDGDGVDGPIALYGGPPIDASFGDVTFDEDAGDGGVVAAYGGPGFGYDASAFDTGAPTDSGEGGLVAAYGAPPVEAGLHHDR